MKDFDCDDVDIMIYGGRKMLGCVGIGWPNYGLWLYMWFQVFILRLKCWKILVDMMLWWDKNGMDIEHWFCGMTEIGHGSICICF